MADEKELELLRNDVAGWNEWRKKNLRVEVILGGADLRSANLIGADLSNAYLSNADLIVADLSGADLSNANLSNAYLTHAYVEGANLSEANLTGADLTGAHLVGANLSEANLSEANLTGANLSEANLTESNLTHASFVSTNIKNADLRGCHIYGVSVWDIETDKETKQTGLIITQRDQPVVMVDDLEVAQFIYLLLNREKLRNVLNAMTQKGVLILGRFEDGGLEVLQAVAGRVREMGYLPMLFDFEPSKSRDFTEFVKTMVGLARFVIVDLSGPGPSVLKELKATVPDFDVPFIPITEEGRKSPSMTTDLTKYPWVRWPPVIFANKERLIDMLPEAVIAPAEKIGKKREKRRAKLFPNIK